MDYDYLKRLLESYSPSGYEENALNEWKKKMNELNSVEKNYADKIGNCAYSIGSGMKTILLSGHIDEVNARVSYISKEGIISIINTGGICKKSMLASHVRIRTDKGYYIDAIVEKKPIHCEENEERDEVGKITAFKINIGCETKEEVEELGIHVGSIVVYERNTILNFGKNQICSQGLDDKIGVFITSEIMKKLSENKDGEWFKYYQVIGMAAVQEETGCRGAKIAASNINPDISIDFDVTFATDGNDLKKEEDGDIALGKGGVIQFGPDKSERLNNLLINKAKEKNIDFQYGVSRAGGTNTNSFQLYSKNCETTLISIPNRNMHTPIEIVDKRDIEAIVNLVYEAIISHDI